MPHVDRFPALLEEAPAVWVAVRCHAPIRADVPSPFGGREGVGPGRSEQMVPREITKRDGQKPCLRIFRELSTALADPTGIATGVRGHSVEAELVALDVLHHEARLVDSIGKQ